MISNLLFFFFKSTFNNLSDNINPLIIAKTKKVFLEVKLFGAEG